MGARHGMAGTPIARTTWHAILLGSIAAWLLTGCIGLWRGDYYAGLSSGDLEACVPFNFDVSIEEGGRIMGLAATTFPWGTVSWDVRVMTEGGDIILETRTSDPRIADPLIRWRGHRRAVSLEVTEEGGKGCRAPRSVTMHRK